MLNSLRFPLLLALIPVPLASGYSQVASRETPIPPALQQALDNARSNNAWTIAQQRSICEIPAPPFQEQRRAEEYRRRFAALGLTSRIDSLGNVIAERPGRRRKPVVVLSAHLDTVFPEETDLTIREAGDTLFAPGIMDDCRGLAVLLSVARAMNEANVVTAGSILFVGTVGEEGLGNLRGVRHLFEREFKNRVDYFLTVDLERYRLVNRAPGSYRYEVSFSGPGGHAFEAFGMPNPVHAAGRAVAALADLSVPKTPKTTFNVGVIRGGTAVNAIADSVAFLLELRSESPSALKGLDSAIRSIVGEAADAERRRWPESHVPLRSEVRLIGDRPAGEVPDSAWILRSARATAGLLGITIEPGAASTDANLPISLGIPALAMGAGGESEGAHSLGEWYRDGPQGWKAIQWAILLATRLSAGPGGNP